LFFEEGNAMHMLEESDEIISFEIIFFYKNLSHIIIEDIAKWLWNTELTYTKSHVKTIKRKHMNGK